jgi:predicted Fe-Mo cluster-binding NifX family protein
MNLIIPVDCNDLEEAQLVSVADAKYWAFLTMDGGKPTNEQFFEKREDIQEWIDVVIVNSEGEHIMPFMEENIAVLVAPMQRYIEDIVEAFIFKELHDLSI